MADAVKPRPVEYYNPRPLILGVCFFWGVAMGFCLFYFRAPEDLSDIGGNRRTTTEQPSATPTVSERERRRQDMPAITDIDLPQTEQSANLPRLETMDIEPPAAILTTDGGLTGRNAPHLSSPGLGEAPQPPGGRPPPMTAPPPIPELMP